MLQGVREVSIFADAEHPTEVPQRVFDAARRRATSVAELPRAKNIAARLRLSWRAVLTLAHEPQSTHAHRLSHLHTHQQDWLTEDYVAFVLRAVAIRLGAESVSPSQYRAERERMLAVDRACWRHGRQLRLPTDDQIRIAVGEWDQALALAGLTARAPHTGNGVTPEELLDRCFEIHGAQATEDELILFARSNGIPYRTRRGRTWSECVEAWKAERRARGLPAPDGLPPRRERPDYSKDVGAARPGERRRHDWGKIEDCAAAVRAYLDQLPSGARSSKRGYQDWASARSDAPSYSAFDQHDGWGRVRALAHERTSNTS
jgi:hypothetical protein